MDLCHRRAPGSGGRLETTAVGVGGFGGLTPKVGDSRVVEIDPFAECMKGKGYTVNP